MLAPRRRMVFRALRDQQEYTGHAPGAPIVHLINAMAVLWVLIHKLGDINCHAQRLTCQSNAPRKKGLDVKSGRPLARFSTRCRPCAALAASRRFLNVGLKGTRHGDALRYEQLSRQNRPNKIGPIRLAFQEGFDKRADRVSFARFIRTSGGAPQLPRLRWLPVQGWGAPNHLFLFRLPQLPQLPQLNLKKKRKNCTSFRRRIDGRDPNAQHGAAQSREGASWGSWGSWGNPLIFLIGIAPQLADRVGAVGARFFQKWEFYSTTSSFCGEFSPPSSIGQSIFWPTARSKSSLAAESAGSK